MVATSNYFLLWIKCSCSSRTEFLRLTGFGSGFYFRFFWILNGQFWCETICHTRLDFKDSVQPLDSSSLPSASTPGTAERSACAPESPHSGKGPVLLRIQCFPRVSRVSLQLQFPVFTQSILQVTNNCLINPSKLEIYIMTKNPRDYEKLNLPSVGH